MQKSRLWGLSRGLLVLRYGVREVRAPAAKVYVILQNIKHLSRCARCAAMLGVPTGCARVALALRASPRLSRKPSVEKNSTGGTRPEKASTSAARCTVRFLQKVDPKTSPFHINRSGTANAKRGVICQFFVRFVRVTFHSRVCSFVAVGVVTNV